jgi:flagellar motor switch protein FliN/FliY
MTSHQEIAHFAEVPVYVEVELDRRTLSIGTILDLKQGSVVKMNRSAGENIDILIGGALVAFGEIVIIEDTMGVRITDFCGDE